MQNSEAAVKPDPQRILLMTKYRFLGDAVLLTPALRAARRTWPKAIISLLTGPAVRNLLKGCPYIDDITLFNPRWREWEPWTNLSLIRELRRRQFDRAILFNRAFHPALIAAAAGIPERIGFATDSRGPLLTTRVPRRPGWRERDCNLEVLRASGGDVATESRLTELWVTEEERDQVRQYLAANGLSLNRPLVSMQPGVRDHPEERQWGSDRFAWVGDYLVQKMGAQILLMGSAEEREVAEGVAAAMKSPALVLAGGPLRRAMAAISLCQLLVGNDSGLVHVAAALGAGTVGLYTPENADRWGYEGQFQRMIVYPCPPGSKPQTVRFHLDSIKAEQVGEAALAVLQARSALRSERVA